MNVRKVYTLRFASRANMVTQNDKHAEITALLRAGLGGDQAAYGKFLNTIAPMLRRMVGRRLANADIEDVVQEVLISIHKARHTYDGERPIMPWLASIVGFRMVIIYLTYQAH